VHLTLIIHLVFNCYLHFRSQSLYVACTRRGKIVYIGISPHPAYAGIIWELLSSFP